MMIKYKCVFLRCSVDFSLLLFHTFYMAARCHSTSTGYSTVVSWCGTSSSSSMNTSRMASSCSSPHFGSKLQFRFANVCRTRHIRAVLCPCFSLISKPFFACLNILFHAAVVDAASASRPLPISFINTADRDGSNKDQRANPTKSVKGDHRTITNISNS